MFAFLKRGDKGRPAPERQSARLGLEGLETRQLLSGFGVGSIVPITAASHALTAPVQTTSPVNAMSSQVANVTRMINDEVHAFSLMF